MLLCFTIVSKTREKEFKSEAYTEFLKEEDNIYNSYYLTSGGYLLVKENLQSHSVYLQAAMRSI